MKLLFVLIVTVLGGCGSGSSTSIAGTYSGTINESFPCIVGAQFAFSDTYVVTVTGSTGTISPQSCSGGSFTGPESSGTISANALTAGPCNQMANGHHVEITDISGTVANEYGGGQRHIDVQLNATATVDGAQCQGGINGMLFPTGR